MNVDLRMDLADCGSPERLLQILFGYYPDLPRRVPLEDIASDVGIIGFKTLEVDGFIGGLTSDPEKNQGIILTKDGLPRKRKRYTIGHELGHFLIPSHGYQRQCSKQDLEESSRTDAYKRQEAEANRFSAGLLMPKPLFTKDIDSLGGIDASHIRQLSDLYDVSMEAVANRYVELSPETCAVIFSREDVVRYSRASKDFPPLDVGKGSQLPLASLTRRHRNTGSPSSWASRHGGIWLQPQRDVKFPTVLEQAVCQSNGFKVTLLYIDEDAEDEENETRELEARWTPHLR
ncbi:ImmA/IrrE family metallo-endopeptidase [Sphingomonas histidinilytica]|uniref:ImmA/IrrE family metallo-endopeptidase n=1 Tax=Rhizorhabdus histidinilytica TaxID=439228 RepID=UPI001AD9A222|nr:ImmA/IrrE family metallo-endopeptidase [Rhizorhabdus histidinilytica]MBO9378075.1 ImmA/IrrE family metallo-endopeptidase [Rhizorhabdus histidinilytica]